MTANLQRSLTLGAQRRRYTRLRSQIRDRLSKSCHRGPGLADSQRTCRLATTFSSTRVVARHHDSYRITGRHGRPSSRSGLGLIFGFSIDGKAGKHFPVTEEPVPYSMHSLCATVLVPSHDYDVRATGPVDSKFAHRGFIPRSAVAWRRVRS